jgi:penicillin-binding protein 2
MKIEGVVMCGKTGTVENYFKGRKQRDHGFFAAFAPRKNPKIAIACIIENGGFGATVAAPIVSLMVEKYINDTISKARVPWIERYSTMKIMPARIQAEINKRDSLLRKAEMEKAIKQMEKEKNKPVQMLNTLNNRQPQKKHPFPQPSPYQKGNITYLYENYYRFSVYQPQKKGSNT